jgi:predicted nucleic acid-binding protein
MIYLDTSVLVPLYVNEPGSPDARRLLASHSQSDLAISEWNRTEFVSAVGIRVRMHNLDSETARNIIETFYRLASRALTLLPVEAGDFGLANRYLEHFELGLRAGDALHLAIASNHGAEVYSSDQVMQRCARRFDIKAYSLP